MKIITILTIRTTRIEPPANGTKMWRVKRSVSASHQSHLKNSKLDPNSSVECLQNSLKISAAGNQYQVRKPPLRRPKNKPGMPKDFVFVDLSPVKNTDESSDEAEKNSLVSPSISPGTTFFGNKDSGNTLPYFELSSSNDSFQSLQSDDESMLSSFDNASVLSNSSTFDTEPYMQVENQINTQSSGNNNAMLGLGIMNMDLTSNAGHWMPENGNICYQENFNYEPMMTYHSSLNPFPAMDQTQADPQCQNLKRSNTVPELPTQEILKSQQSNSHKRAKSASEPSKKRFGSTFQFKAYKAPPTKEKKTARPKLNHRRTISEPAASTIPKKTSGLEAFMDLNNQISVALANDESSFDETNSFTAESNSLTPNTDYSETEDCDHDLLKSSNMDAYFLGGCAPNQFLPQNQLDFDFNAFVSY